MRSQAYEPALPAHKRHVVPPATAEEIRAAVGVTAEDRAIVDQIFRQLGFAPETPDPAVKKITASSARIARSSKTAQTASVAAAIKRQSKGSRTSGNERPTRTQRDLR